MKGSTVIKNHELSKRQKDVIINILSMNDWLGVVVACESNGTRVAIELEDHINIPIVVPDRFVVDGIQWTRPGDCEHAIDDRLLYEVQNGNGETYIAEYNADHFIDTKTGRRVAAERFRSIGTLGDVNV